MTCKGIIFADMDGTLTFHESVHGIKPGKKTGNGMLEVTYTKSQTKYKVYDVSIGDDKVYFGVETRDLINRLRQNYEFVIVTGATKSTISNRKWALDIADYYILESGGLLLNKDFEPDYGWQKSIQSDKVYLIQVQNYLQQQGWTLNIKGRTAALRIRKKDNPEKSADEFNELSETLQLPDQLKITNNMGYLDIIPARSGKGNAVCHVMNTLGYHKIQSIGIGDDINDLDFLKETERNYILASGFPEVLEEARKKGWYVSHGLNFDGINEILKRIENS